MELPLSYIILSIMKILKEHKKETRINREELFKIINELLESPLISEKAKDEMVDNLDFNEDIAIFLDNYIQYFESEISDIILHKSISIQELDTLLDDVKISLDDDLAQNIDYFFNFNVPVFDILDIRIEKNLYHSLYELEQEIINEYNELAQIDMCNDVISEKKLYNLKKLVVKRNLLFSAIKNNISIIGYGDLCAYSTYLLSKEVRGDLKLKIPNGDFYLNVLDDPFYRALFFADDEINLNLRNELFSYITNNDDNDSRIKFFINVMDNIESHVNRLEDDLIDDDLVNTKYKLMFSIDTALEKENIFNKYTFMGYRGEDISSNDYSFIKNDIFFLIDEVLEYTDSDIACNTCNDYNNTIKAILIETYYDLTGDENIINRIKNNPNYGKYHFITYLFENIMNKNKTRKRKKEDE